MSIEATTWALTVPLGGSQKVLLLGIANHAHPDGTESYPAIATLATYAHCDRSTVKRNLRKMEAAGWIIPDGYGPRGQVKYRLPLGGAQSAPGANPAGEGAHLSPEGGAPMPPEPSIGTVHERVRGRTTRADAPPDAFPDDLPPELHGVAIHAGKILKATAMTRRQPKAVTRAAVGHAVLTYPDRDHVQVARDVENWMLHGRGAGQSCRDVVARFRSFLKSSEPKAAPPLPGNVRPMRGRSQPGGDLTIAQIAAS